MKFERLFKIASYGLFVSGFLALAFTGAVDLYGILFLVIVFFFLLFGIACLVLHEIFSSKLSFGETAGGDSFWGAGTFFANTALLTVLMCLLAVPFFFILPRFQTGFLGHSPKSSNLSGFSDHVNLGDIGRIKLNPAVVMRVKVNRPVSA